MHKEETIGKFNARLCDIANKMFMLGEKMPEAKLVRKTLRSLPIRFAYKVTAIEEAKDVTTLKLEELMGSLRMFEMNFEEERAKKNQGIVLKVDTKRDDLESRYDDDEDLVELIEILSKNIERVMKMNGRSCSGVPQSVLGPSQNIRNHNPSRKNKAADSSSDNKNRRSTI